MSRWRAALIAQMALARSSRGGDILFHFHHACGNVIAIAVGNELGNKSIHSDIVDALAYPGFLQPVVALHSEDPAELFVPDGVLGANVMFELVGKQRYKHIPLVCGKVGGVFLKVVNHGFVF